MEIGIVLLLAAIALVLCLVFGRLMGNTAYSFHHAKATGKPARSEKDLEQADIDRFSR